MGIDIIKVFSLNALSTFIRMLAGMISVKVIAVFIGPAGIALLGQLNNFSTILLGMANGGISSGITKYVSEYKNDESLIKLYISNALRLSLICSIIVALFLFFCSRQLSKLILLSSDYYYVYIIFGLTIFLFTLNHLIISILNGYKEFKLYVKVSIVGTFVSLLYSTILIILWGLPGALINAVTFQSIMFFVTLWMCRRLPWMKSKYFLARLNKTVVKKYFGYSLMTLTSLAMLPVSQMLLRGYVISELSTEEAGIWEGMNRISTMYLSVITSALSVYYLPRLSEITCTLELHNEIFKCYKIIVPFLLVISIAIYGLKHSIIWLLFTPDFYPMENLFAWQLCGDFFKMTSWMLSYLMVAKAKTVLFITTEIVFTFSYILLSFLFIQYNGIVGLTQGYLINYFLYLIAMVFFFKNIIIIKTT